MIITLILFVVTCAISYGILRIAMWHFQRRRLYEMISEFEGPPVLPFIGNGHLIVGNGEYILSKFYETNNLYPSPCRVWLGPLAVLFISDPEQIKTVCLSPNTIDKGSVFVKAVRPFVGEGLLTAPASRWKVHRKLIQPTFSKVILDSFVEVFAAQSKIYTKKMERHLNGQEFEIFNMTSLCTLDMICETTTGVKVEAQTNPNCRYVEAVHKILTRAAKRIATVWLHPDTIFHFSQVGRDQRMYLKFLHNFTDNVIEMKKRELSKCNNRQDEVYDEDDPLELPLRKKAFLDHLMTLPPESGSLSDKEIREEVDTIVVAGNDTTAVTISYAMLMLASHPDIQEKAYQELYEIYGDDDIEEHPTAPKDLPRMKYLERVIKETLRLFPVGPYIIREVTEDLNVGDHVLPKGSSTAIAILNVHRNEKYWPDPLKFDPDRFLPEKVARRHPYAFMAFSGGPRNCIGLNYAMMSTKTILAAVLRRYILKKDNVVPIADIRLKFEITLNPVEPVKLRIERRTGNSFRR